MSSIGALVGGIVAFYVTYNYWLSNDDDTLYISLGVAVSFGVICGVLFCISIFMGVVAFGGIAALFLLSTINVHCLQEHHYILVLIPVVVAVIIGVTASRIQKILLVLLATFVISTLLITVRINYFLELGRMMQYAYNVMHHILDTRDCWYSWSVLGLFVIILIVSILVKVFVTGCKYDNKKHMQGKHITVEWSRNDCRMGARAYS